MLTLQEVKRIVDTPEEGTALPSAKHLKECGSPILCKRIGKGVKLTVYQEGYAVYEIGKNATVFSVSACGDYEYGEPGRSCRICREYFDGLAWYIRLFLEGEDRLYQNREWFEGKKSISYSAVSEEWQALEDLGEPMLECLIRKETLKEYMDLLTERQRLIICRFYFQKQTQREIAAEFDITPAAVRRIRGQAIRRIQKKRGHAGRKKCCGKEVFSCAG